MAEAAAWYDAMKPPALTKADLKQLVTTYVIAASRHGEATESGDSRTANKNFDAIAGVYAELRSRGEREVLLPLLEHSDPGVRSWAASHALEFAPKAGKPVLAKLAKQQGGVAFSAEMTLEAWKKGELKFP